MSLSHNISLLHLICLDWRKCMGGHCRMKATMISKISKLSISPTPICVHVCMYVCMCVCACVHDDSKRRILINETLENIFAEMLFTMHASKWSYLESSLRKCLRNQGVKTPKWLAWHEVAAKGEMLPQDEIIILQWFVRYPTNLTQSWQTLAGGREMHASPQWLNGGRGNLYPPTASCHYLLQSRVHRTPVTRPATSHKWWRH